MWGEGSGNKNVTEKTSMSVMYGSSCIRDRGGGQGGEPSLWGFCLCLLRFLFSFSLCVFVVCIHACGAHRDHKRESEALSEPPNKDGWKLNSGLLREKYCSQPRGHDCRPAPFQIFILSYVFSETQLSFCLFVLFWMYAIRNRPFAIGPYCQLQPAH